MELKKIYELLDKRWRNLMGYDGNRHSALTEEGVAALKEIRKALEGKYKQSNFESVLVWKFGEVINKFANKALTRKREMTIAVTSKEPNLKPVLVKTIDDFLRELDNSDVFDLKEPFKDGATFPVFDYDNLNLKEETYDDIYTQFEANLAGGDILEKMNAFKPKWEASLETLETISNAEEASFLNGGVSEYTDRQKEVAVRNLRHPEEFPFNEYFGSDNLINALELGKSLIKHTYEEELYKKAQ